jgi:hypothetical protein
MLIGLTIFISVYPYNAFKENKINKKLNEAETTTKLIDSLSNDYNKKLNNQNWFFKKWSTTFDLSEDTQHNTLEKVWTRIDFLAQRDSIDYKWKNVWHKDLVTFHMDIGFNNPADFKKFIDDNRISDIDKSNFNLASEKEIKKSLLEINITQLKNSKFSQNEQTDLAKNTILISIILVFGFRYLIYGVKWSLRTLKEKDQ